MRSLILIATLLYSTWAYADVGGIDVYAEGSRLHLLVGNRGNNDAAPTVDYLVSEDGGSSWSKPAAVGARLPVPYRVETGDIQVAASGKVTLVVWSAKGAGPMGSGPIVAARSTDGGKTWQPAGSPAGRGRQQGMRFVDLTADPSGAFHAVWLDRKSSARLTYARSSDGARSWSAPQVLDADTCECCWNTLAAGSSGRLFALYRAKNPRDMALFSSKDGGKKWGAKTHLGGFDWRVNMCPHAGGGLALGGKDLVHAVVWTGQDERVGLYHLVSSDGGQGWSKPQRIGDDSAKHSDIAARSSSVAVVWDGTRDGRSAVFAAISMDDGKSWQSKGPISGNGSAAYPRIVPTESGFRVFWLKKSDGGTSWTGIAL